MTMLIILAALMFAVCVLSAMGRKAARAAFSGVIMGWLCGIIIVVWAWDLDPAEKRKKMRDRWEQSQ